MFIEELGTYIFNPDYVTAEDGGVEITAHEVTRNGRVAVKATRLATVTVGTVSGKEFTYNAALYSSTIVLDREQTLACFNDKGAKHPSETYVKYLEKNGNSGIEDNRIEKSIAILTDRLSEKLLNKAAASLNIEGGFDPAQAIDLILNERGDLEVPCDNEDCYCEEEPAEVEPTDEEPVNEEPAAPIVGDPVVGEEPVSVEVVGANETSEPAPESIL